jgi:rRNA processing protein Gar1
MFTGDPDSGTEITNSRRLIQEENVASEDRLRELEEKYEDFKVYDNQGEKIGKVDDLFVDETDREEYIGVKLGFLGL